MTKVNILSPYNHFPNNTDKSSPIRMYCDGTIWQALEENPRPTDMLLLIEPRSLQEINYTLAMLHYNRFKYIFTHDSQLLSFAPNALPIYYWRDYELKVVPKTKNISMICGTKDMCPLHHERMKIADYISDKVDILGDYHGNRCTIDEAYSEYRFAVVIENYHDDRWMTEKVLNAFSHKTVPIYYGAKNISQVFNKRGIIEVSRLWDIPDVIDILYEKGIENEYNRMMEHITENYGVVQAYENFEDYFYSHYGELLAKLSEV